MFAMTFRMVLITIVGVLVSKATCQAESFDKPIHKQVVNLGRSKYLMPNDTSRIELTCFYYTDFLIKQLNDPGMKGVRWATITRVSDGQVPPCKQAHSSSEKFLKTEQWWWFIGIKENLLYFEASDGDSAGGMPFRVIDPSTEKLVFKDSGAQYNERQHKFEELITFGRTADGRLTLKYKRIVLEKCSIPKDGNFCWNNIRNRLNLQRTMTPACFGFEGKPISGNEISEPSVIRYPVEVELSPTVTIRPLKGEIQCGSPI